MHSQMKQSGIIPMLATHNQFPEIRKERKEIMICNSAVMQRFSWKRGRAKIVEVNMRYIELWLKLKVFGVLVSKWRTA